MSTSRLIVTATTPKKNGGARPGAGAKPIDPQEKKATVSFQIKRKHVADAKAKIQPIVDKLNRG